MKKFSLFGLKFMFEVKRSSKNDVELYSTSYALREKIIYLILIMFIIAFSSKIGLLSKNNNYSVGDVVISDIYAPKTIVFNDKSAKEKIIENMIAQSGKEYIYSADAGRIYLETFDEFFDDIYALKNNKDSNVDFKNLEKDTGRRIPDTMVKDLLSLKVPEIMKLQKETRKFLENLYESGIIQEKATIKYRSPFDKKIEKLSNLQRQVVETFAAPNYIYDEDKTKKAIEEKVSQINDQYIEIKAGTLVAKKGEILNERRIKILESCGVYSYKKSLGIMMANLTYLFIISTLFYQIIFNRYKKDILRKSTYRSTVLIIIAFFLTFRFINNDLIYLMPADTALFLLVLLTNTKYGLMMISFMLFFLLPIIDYDLIFLVMNIASMTFGAYLIKKVNTRAALIAVGIQMAVLKVATFGLLSFFSEVETFGAALKSGEIIVSGLVSGMIAIALLPYFEKTFNILTLFKLLELGDLSHPLLKKLSMEAPGTFHHSMMVATLSENAAAAVGANAVFARVASYYHDIGKCKRPQFYVENQQNGENPHNRVSPFMSNLIITSHTKDGAEMAKQYQIPREIRNIMYEHQGTTFLAYFYNKAKALDPTVTKEEFRYSGPKPRSKESAIIMLADSIEAAVRSLDEKTPRAIEEMLRKIINSKIEDNQLSEADLTFKEIEIIIHTFVKSLISIHHVRIKYPGQK
ncbi:HDIG domain-containing metalloprotein [Fusobacterium sp.]|uniref:HD family phosphohydrolase n=1 Tax=Fusobacterium sp. TaxID=68766 RepID=UPI001D9024F3|nr:HDIG domain-containing metalloprotein [Fusobacterium sp.]MBS5790692.1 HDIG domain-containing protein [Fusobacterium sp.]